MTYTEAENKIKKLLDDEFLSKLLEIGKLYGWNGDYVEIGALLKNYTIIMGLNM